MLSGLPAPIWSPKRSGAHRGRTWGDSMGFKNFLPLKAFLNDHMVYSTMNAQLRLPPP